MSASDFSKIILSISGSFAIIGISIFLMKLLSVLTSNLSDLRETVVNIGILTKQLVEDQKVLRKGIETFVSATGKLENGIDSLIDGFVKPLTLIGSVISSISAFVSSFIGKSVEK